MSQQMTRDEPCHRTKKCLKTAKFLERIGATVEGVKPAELLTIGEREYGEVYGNFFHRNKSLLIRTIKRSNTKRQIFFYHRQCLGSVLEKNSVQWFLVSLGYPEQYSMDDYIDHLAARLCKNEFPHEIGVFLGYPLKDVFGYMGMNSLPHTKTMGWRMYGNTSKSERLYLLFCNARQRACKALYHL